MRVYFVRHGESEENVNDIYRGPAAKLTETGYAQARFVAERFTTIPIDLILSSTMERAKETARIISEKIGQGVIHSDLLVETKAPSEFLHKEYDDPEAVSVRNAWLKTRYVDEHARYSDEENVADLKVRAKQALLFIADQKVNDCLVVSHGTFLRIILGIILEGDDFSSQMFLRMRNAFSISNTGITMFDYNVPDSNHRHISTKESQPGDGTISGWRLITWNDHAHLG